MNPWEVLALPVGADPLHIRKRYRQLAMRYHPDREGGDAAIFDQLTKAKNQALIEYEKIQARLAVCPKCKGTRRVRIVRGFATLTMTCDACRGTGRV